MASKLFILVALAAVCIAQARTGNKTTVVGLERYESSQHTEVWTSLGFILDLVDDATWNSMTAADFATYAAISIMDPDCASDLARLDILESTAAVWGPAVNGPVIVIGTDESYHFMLDDESYRGKKTMQGLANFVVSDATKLGAYISLSCYYQDTPEDPVTEITFLNNAFTGPFKIAGINAGGSTYTINNAHIVSSHPALVSLNDGILSGWNQSVHEYFTEDVPGFIPLAIVLAGNNKTGWFTAQDSTNGAPYILARGTIYVTDITIAASTPLALTNTEVTYTATVTGPRGSDLRDLTIEFVVTSGPNAGTIGTAKTNEQGVATLPFTGTLSGLDTIVAKVTIPTGMLTSTSTTVDWAAPQETTEEPTTTQAPTTQPEPTTRDSTRSGSSSRSGSSGRSSRSGTSPKKTTAAPPATSRTVSVTVRCNKGKFSGTSISYYKGKRCDCTPARTACSSCVMQFYYTPASPGVPAKSVLYNLVGCSSCTKAGWLFSGRCYTTCPSTHYAVARKKPTDQFRCNARKP